MYIHTANIAGSTLMHISSSSFRHLNHTTRRDIGRLVCQTVSWGTNRPPRPSVIPCNNDRPLKGGLVFLNVEKRSLSSSNSFFLAFGSTEIPASCLLLATSDVHGYVHSHPDQRSVTGSSRISSDLDGMFEKFGSRVGFFEDQDLWSDCSAKASSYDVTFTRSIE